MLLERGDAIVVLPGGIGTLDEITEVLEKKKHSLHNKPIVFLNTGGFYDGFKLQMERMGKEGFLPKALVEYMGFADTPNDAMRYIENYGVWSTKWLRQMGNTSTGVDRLYLSADENAFSIDPLHQFH